MDLGTNPYFSIRPAATEIPDEQERAKSQDAIIRSAEKALLDSLSCCPPSLMGASERNETILESTASQ